MRTIALAFLAFLAALAACSSSPASSPTPTLQMTSPLVAERAVMITVEETEVQTNVLVDEPDLRVAVVSPRGGVTDIEPAIGIWQPGGDFVVCGAELARDGAWLAFGGACASGRVLLP
jgi:ABC-type glycerol-3-phosphate transport system substrate-binding protein